VKEYKEHELNGDYNIIVIRAGLKELPKHPLTLNEVLLYVDCRTDF
jgi:hypothetical protein